MAPANATSSSPAGRSVDLAAAGLLPPLPGAFVEGRELDLLAPLTWLRPGELPRAAGEAPERRDLAAGLAAANASYGHPGAEELGAKLAEPGTAVVVTGQQPGLFGGPLYTLSKAVAAGRWAAALEAAGTPAVAVFWMATEDHDFRESSWAGFQFPDRFGRVGLGDDPDPLMPLGVRSLGPAVETAFGELRESMPGERFAGWCDTLATWYRPTARFGEAFARLLAHLLGERCPLILDAMLPAVKTAERRWLARTVELRAEIEDALAAASAKVEARGLPLQVTPQPGMSPLFFLEGRERRRIGWQSADEWSLRGDDELCRPVAELEEAIAENPAVVMPGVLVRPVIQDAILGSTLQVMGPGEMSYLPQLAPLYEVLDVPAPATALRPQALMLPAAQAKKLEQTGLDIEALVAADFDPDALLAGEDSVARLEPARAALDRLEETLTTAAEPVAAEMKSAIEKTLQQARRGVEAFGGRLTGALGRADEVRRNRLEALARWVRPDGLQERALSTADLPGRYGEACVDALWEQLQLDGSRMTIVEW